jgi:hypothetical protein
MAPQYPRSKIYKIVNTVNDIIYVGSTTLNYLSSRMGTHRQDHVKPERGSPIYVAMRAIGFQHFKIVLEHNFPCLTKDELEKEEYRVLDAYIAAGTSIYNSKINGEHSVEARLKIGAANTGENNRRFTYGSVNFCSTPGRKPAWMLQYRLNGKAFHKTRAVAKYGFWQAKAMIEAERKLVFPNWVKDPEEDILDQFNAIEMD